MDLQVSALALVLALPVAHLVNSIVPNVYMDELFHVPQAQQYCQWNFSSWDPMITTFPGLYLSTVVYKSLLSPWTSICSVTMLRSINIWLALICMYLFSEILIQLRPHHAKGTASLKALVLALYPLHWFFTFLYYTDVGSTAAVMAMYLACLKKRYWISALFSIAAVLFRQTNAVWTVFVLSVGVIQLVQDKVLNDAEPSIEGNENPTDRIVKRRQKLRRQKRSQGLLGEMKSLFLGLWRRKNTIFKSLSPFVAVILVFVSFVFYNGSIVVGAKDAHTVSPHFAQPLYFALFTGGFLAPFHFSPRKLCLLRTLFHRSPRLTSATVIITTVICLFTVHHFSLAHPYLLADNRHYTFYIWKDIIQSHCCNKYLLVPLYVYAWWSIIQSLAETLDIKNRHLKTLWIISFCAATLLVLVPAPLVEFRYFTVPFYILALHTLSDVEIGSWRLWFIALEFVAVNIVTMKLFLFNPFYWPHEGGVQRFIW